MRFSPTQPFSEKNNYSSSSYPAPPSPNNASPSQGSNSRLETGIGSLVLTCVTALLSTASLSLAVRQDAMSSAHLRLATAVAAATDISVQSAQGAGTGAWSIVREAHRVAGAISAGGLAAAGTGASSLASGVQNGWSSTAGWVASLPKSVPGLSSYGGSNGGVIADTARDESPIVLVDNEVDQSEESDVSTTWNGDRFEVGELVAGVYYNFI